MYFSFISILKIKFLETKCKNNKKLFSRRGNFSRNFGHAMQFFWKQSLLHIKKVGKMHQMFSSTQVELHRSYSSTSNGGS